LVNYERQIFGRNVHEPEIIVGLGSTELTSAFFLACLDAGTEIIITNPAYLNYPRQVQIEGLLQTRIKRWPIIDNHTFEPNLDALQDTITDTTRLILVTSPCNPDGQVFTDDTLDAITDIAEDHDVWVMIDLAYRAFCYGAAPAYLSRQPRENEIWMCSLSKEFRILGWRVAYAIADEKSIEIVNTIEQARTLCPNRLAQEILVGILHDNQKLDDLKAFHDATRLQYGKIAQETVEILQEKIPKAYVLKPMGGFYVFVDISPYGKDSRTVCRQLLNEWQVALAPRPGLWNGRMDTTVFRSCCKHA
jgi:aspartate/methionine/tyrosine aminotransferase